jgi:microcystin-dependent protein
MSYNVRYSELNNPQKTTIVVEDQTLNSETSLTFVGKNYAGYAQFVAENFLHLLENFAKATAPTNPVQGQLWFDSTAGVNQLKVYDGTTWTAAGSVKKATSAPSVSNSIKGDLWVDTDNQQLYMFSGSSWVLIGPQFSGGLKTGPDVESIVDTSNNAHGVVSLYSDGDRIAIISNTQFAPKSSIVGFEIIGKGLNLSTVDATNSTAPMKVWGTASKADALVVNNAVIPSTSFLRSDQVSTTNFGLNVRSNSGIGLGGDLSFNIGTDTNSAVLYSKTSNSVIDFKLTLASGDPKTVMRINSTENITNVGINKTNPNESLDVAGNIRSDTGLIVTGTGSTSILTAGGIQVGGASSFTGQVTANAPVIFSYIDANGNPRTDNPVIAPSSDAANMKYDIGTPTRAFRNIYAETFVGAFSGSFSGSLTGNISGTAARLASATLFQLVGDVTSNQISFNGQTANGTATFQTVIGQDMIDARESVASAYQTDEFLLLRPNLGLRKITKQTLFASAATVPTGAIIPFAGPTAPAGYLLCDGSEKLKGKYNDLYNVIGDTYTPNPNDLVGLNTFKIPDLRGRFPLGLLDMDNGDSVPKKTNTVETIDSGGGIPNDLAARVSSSTAATLGNVAGFEQITLNRTQLPEHQHELVGESGQYYAINNNTEIPTDTGARLLSVAGNTSVQALPKTGGIDAPTISQAVNITNPYLTINYIIYSGVHNDI